MPAMLATPPRSLQAHCTACRLSNVYLATNKLTFGDADGVIRSLRVRGRQHNDLVLIRHRPPAWHDECTA